MSDLRAMPWALVGPSKDGQRFVLGPRQQLYVTDATESLGNIALKELAPELSSRLPAPPPARTGASPEELYGQTDHCVVTGPLTAGVAGVLISSLREATALRWQFVESSSGSAGILLDVGAGDYLGSRPHSRARIFHGETSEGCVLGPILRTANDVDAFNAHVAQWSLTNELKSLGFEVGPSTLAHWCEVDPDTVARWVRWLLASKPWACGLLEQGRAVSFGTPAAGPWTSHDIDALSWDHGLFRGFTSTAYAELGDVHVAGAEAPCFGIAELEGNSGKGASLEGARVTTIGECVERLSAALGPRILSAPAGADRYSLERFHPFGAEWERHCASPELETSYVVGTELLSKRLVQVPDALIRFPLLPDAAGRRPSQSHTAGLAVHPVREEAVARALLEVLERDDLYPNFLGQQPGFAIVDRTPLRDAFATAGFRPRLVSYRRARRIKILHAFCIDPMTGALVRGSGSGFSVHQAIDAALLESVQLAEQARTYARDLTTQPYPWLEASAVSAVVTYLDRMECCESDARQPEPHDSAQRLESLLEHLREDEREAIVVDLECPIANWFAVRVLVPGACCHQQASISDGGRKLQGRVFSYVVPN